MAKIISISGKGGVGKTTSIALLLDELARAQYRGRLLVIDADPAMTLHLALGFDEPAATLATIRDSLSSLGTEQVRELPGGVGQHAIQQLQKLQALSRRKIRTLHFDMLSMGWGEGKPGCYCSINNTLSWVIESLLDHYDLVLVDNEAGMEHLSRHRIKRVDLFITVTDGGQASVTVGKRLLRVAQEVGIEIVDQLEIRILTAFFAQTQTARNGMNSKVIVVPHSYQVRQFAAAAPVVRLEENHPLRNDLQPLVKRLINGSG